MAFSLRFAIGSSFLSKALSVDVDSHSVASISVVFFVVFILQALASWSDLLLLPTRGILIDDEEYKGKRMMTNEPNRALATEFQSMLFTSATIVNGSLRDANKANDDR